MEVKEKRCSGKLSYSVEDGGCGGIIKPLEDFTNNGKRKDGTPIKRAACKLCMVVWQTKYLRENPKTYAKRRASINVYNEKGYKLGIVVYVIRNYDGKGNDYIGQTNNFPARMRQHKNGDKAKGIPPKLNTENAEILHYCGDDREKALKIEASYHDKGYHGRVTGRPMKVNKVL